MCPSRLPNDVTSYRPIGMLDRDQRTAYTIRRIRRDDPLAISKSTITNTISASENSRLNFTQQCSGCEQLTTVQEARMNLFGSLSCRCLCDYGNSRIVSGIRLRRKYTASNHRCYRSQGKFVNCLLVFICIWLAAIRCTCAYPVMFDDNDQDPDAQRCKAIRNALNKPMEQTNTALHYIRALLDNYTQAQFKKQPLEVHQEWKIHPAHFHYGTDIKQFLPEDFDGEIPMSHYEHLLIDGIPSENELSIEFQRIYICIQTLKKVFDHILDDRKNNASQIMHHLNNDRETHEAIGQLFKEVSRYINLDIAETETAMSTLQIPYPDVGEVIIEKKDRIISEWLATREYLKVLKYMQKDFEVLFQRCS